MRTRFFFTTLLILLFVSFAVIYLHGLFLQREKWAVIDQQIRETASVLVESQLGDLRKFNFKQAEGIISQELGASRIGKFVIVRNSKGEVIFESSSADVLPIHEIAQNKRWITVNTKENLIRILNLQLPSFPDRTLQVGVVLSHELITPQYFSRSAGILLLAILGLGCLLSFFLTSFLLRPIATLSQFIAQSSEQLKSDQMLTAVPAEIETSFFTKSSALSRNDEYLKLILGFNSLIDKVNRHYRNTKFWAYQMAHELKTPLTLMNLETESLSSLSPSPELNGKVESIQVELRKVSETISSFLSWAELENSSPSRNLYANKLANTVKLVLKRLESSGDKFELVLLDEPTILCNPSHLEQLFLNLITNALKHSQHRNVKVTLDTNRFIIEDQGPGIPKSVIDRLGEPFNKGSELEGSGLGLAWVSSLCKLYDWKLEIVSTPKGTQVQIVFSPEAY